MKYTILYRSTEDVKTTSGANVASFFLALQKLSAVLPASVQVDIQFAWSAGHAEKFKAFLNRIPRNFTFSVGDVSIWSLVAKGQAEDVVATIGSDVLMSPESLAILFDLSQVRDYVSGHDMINELPSKIIFMSSRHWRTGIPVGGSFAARISTLREDKDTWDILGAFELAANWQALMVLKSRTPVTPMPALWHVTTEKAPPVGVPWQQLQEFIIKSWFGN